MSAGDDQNPPKVSRYEPFSTYYLHPSEGTGTVISPIILKGDNYEEWSRSFRNNLRAKNKLGFIDGTVTIPDSKSPDFEQWGIVNAMLVAWIVNTLDVSIRSTVRFPDNVKVLWDDLRDRYSIGNGLRILELKTQIADCKQRGRSVASYYGELRKLQDELASYSKFPTCTCNAAAEFGKIQENELLYQFLIGLDHKKFGSVVSSLLMMEPVPSLNVAYTKVVAEERKHTVMEAQDLQQRPEVVGFAASGQSQSRAGKGAPSRVCSHCGKAGHEKEKCFELVGWPEWYTRARGGSARGRGGSGVRGGGSRGRTSAPTLTEEECAQFIDTLDPQVRRVFFPGREKEDDDETLLMAGLKDHSLTEQREENIEEPRKKEEVSKQCAAIAEVRAEVDKLSRRVYSLEACVHSGTKVDEKEFMIVTELLMVELLKLDSIEAEGEAKAQRKSQVHRVQGYVDALDALKAKNSNTFGNCSNTV